MTADTQAPAPTGDMVLVPREPTQEMLAAIAHADWFGKDDLDWRDGWRIMLAAAPSPSASTMGSLPRHTGDGGWTLPPLWLADIRKEAAAAEEWAGQIALEGVEAIALVVERRIQSCLSSAGGEGTVEAREKRDRLLFNAGWDAARALYPVVPTASLTPPKAETETASERERLVEALNKALAVLDRYADPAAHNNSFGEEYEADEAVHPGVLARDTAAEIRAALAQEHAR